MQRQWHKMQMQGKKSRDAKAYLRAVSQLFRAHVNMQTQFLPRMEFSR